MHERARRVGLATALAVATSACAHHMTAQELEWWGPTAGPLCPVRVENAYEQPVVAGARAGAREISLGVIDADGRRDFKVPCAHRAVTVYRVVRSGEAAETRLAAHARALDAEDVTVLQLSPGRPGTR